MELWKSSMFNPRPINEIRASEREELREELRSILGAWGIFRSPGNYAASTENNFYQQMVPEVILCVCERAER